STDLSRSASRLKYRQALAISCAGRAWTARTSARLVRVISRSRALDGERVGCGEGSAVVIMCRVPSVEGLDVTVQLRCRISSSCGVRQGHDEQRATSGIVFDRDRPSMGLDNALRDAQSQPVAAGLLGTRSIDAEERLEEIRLVVFGNPRAIVSHPDDDRVAILCGGHLPPSGI